MNRLGVCAGVDAILAAEAAGFEYLEGNLSEIALLPEPAFQTRRALVGEAGIDAEVFGCMLPRELNVTGLGVNAAELHEYLGFAFDRACVLGAKVIVFASPCARQVPEGFPVDVAWRQISNFLRIVEKHASQRGLTVAVEPLCRSECNILNTVAEATLLTSILQLPHIRVLADSYHMAMGHEPLSALSQAGPLLCHVHTANALGRAFPKAGDGEDYTALFLALKRADYTGRVSVEGAFEDFEGDAKEAFAALDAARRAVV